MLSLVKDWRASGLTQTKFSSRHGIKPTKLRYWVARSKDSGTGGFIPLAEGSVPAPGPVEIIYPSGVRLRVAPDLALVSRLIRL